jgi:hypothetical protein
MKTIIRSTFIIIIIATFTFAGGWTQKKGSGFYKLDFRYLPGKAVYNDDGEKVQSKLSDLSFGIYAEYGLSNSLTLFTTWIPFQKISIKDSAGTVFSSPIEESGIGDASIGVRYLITSFNNSVLSISGALGIPLGNTSVDNKLWLGTGEWNQTIGLEFGHSFYPARAYVSSGVYYRNKNEGFSDDIKWGVESGYSFNENLSIIGKFHGLNTLNNGAKGYSGGYAIYSNNQKYIAYGLQVIYKLKSGIGFAVGYESGTAGRNIISAPVFSAGIFFSN